jgi:hypothetical protein
MDGNADQATATTYPTRRAVVDDIRHNLRVRGLRGGLKRRRRATSVGAKNSSVNQKQHAVSLKNAWEEAKRFQEMENPATGHRQVASSEWNRDLSNRPLSQLQLPTDAVRKSWAGQRGLTLARIGNVRFHKPKVASELEVAS